MFAGTHGSPHSGVNCSGSGWYNCSVGDWEADPVYYPNGEPHDHDIAASLGGVLRRSPAAMIVRTGIKPVSDAAHDAGLHLMMYARPNSLL